MAKKAKKKKAKRTPPVGLSIRAYASHRKENGLSGGTLRAVQVALHAGRISRNKHGKIDPVEADRMWIANTLNTQEPVSNVVSRWRRSQEKSRAVLLRNEVLKQRGMLIPREQVISQARTIGEFLEHAIPRILKEHIDALAATRSKQRIEEMIDRIHEELYAEAQGMLENVNPH